MEKADMAASPTAVKKITIVGGGSAGWITACLLNSYLNSPQQGRVNIQLIESPNIPSMGVGEATIPGIRRTLHKIGIPEATFMKETDATFKSLIRFDNWNIGESFDHPFDRRDRANTNDAVKAWFALNKEGGDFAKKFSLLSHICDQNLAPKGVGWPDYESAFPYAYHLDAVKLAELLTRVGVSQGINHVPAEVADVQVNEDGNIEQIVTQEGQSYTADIFIDCTGFSARLISKLCPDIHDYSNTLMCDSAVTVQVPYTSYKPRDIRPHTVATARNAGWNWDINLRTRRGVGYVYSSAHLSEEQAEAELLEFEGKHAKFLPIRHIKFKTYKRQKTWAGNCLAIGLSDCFMEPLESSGLYMIEFAAHLLGKVLEPSQEITAAARNHFNRVTQSLSEEVLDFVALHYLTSTRRDTEFWKEATKIQRAPAHLQDLLEQWKTRMFIDTDMLSLHRLFSVESYEFLLYGMNYTRPKMNSPIPPFTHDISTSVKKCLTTLPKHKDWLSRALI